MDLPEKSTQDKITGKLALHTNTENILFSCTSGLPGFQYHGGWKIPRKGCIPPSRLIKEGFYVSTQRLWLPNVPGVEGSFYAASPFSANYEGVTRGDFGLHADKNRWGSAGCIVFRLEDHYKLFEQYMKQFSTERIKSLPLEVVYN